MNRLYTSVSYCIMLVLLCINSYSTMAATGDTTIINAYTNEHLGAHGNYDQWVQFPHGNTHYGKIIMDYRLGCPSAGCSAWDYTTQLFAYAKSGQFDSTLAQYPNFLVNGNIQDSLLYNSTISYLTFYNSTIMGTDSFPAPLIMLVNFSNSVTPSIPTDTMYVFPGNYYNYHYNSTGQIIDSAYVGYNQIVHLSYYNVYTVFEITEPFELARVMTPYGSTFSAAWGRDFMFDVTDYAPIFNDSIQMRIFYDGWSDGFTASVTFYFIEGTPPRNPIRVRNIYPTAYYEYGITTNPIESHLTPDTLDIMANEHMGLIRVVPSGHSFGGNLNCAEFCAKNYRLLINNTQRFQQLIWRDDCGLNPLLNQNGTWIYDRSNWCPGQRTNWKDHELTPYITPGSDVVIDMNLDAYVYSGGAGFNPGYFITAQLVTYDSINFSLNAGVSEILAPNADIEYSRFNPICNNPVVKITNYGSGRITSLNINYGIKGGMYQVYPWTGRIDFNESITLTLGNLPWGSGTGNQDVFEVWTSDPNGTQDQYAYNDTMRSSLTFTPMLPAQFHLYWKSNLAYTETTYTLKDLAGNTLYSNKPLTSANQIFRDTFNLSPGCYQLKLSDSGKDGLQFGVSASNVYNNDGSGFARLMTTSGTSTILKILEPNFGTSLTYNFTVGFSTTVAEHLENAIFQISPNPASGQFIVNLILPSHEDLELNVLNQLGQIVYSLQKPDFLEEMMSIDLGNQPPGMYFVRVKTKSGTLTKKLVLQN